MKPFEFIVKWRWPTCEVTIGPDGPVGPLHGIRTVMGGTRQGTRPAHRRAGARVARIGHPPPGKMMPAPGCTRRGDGELHSAPRADPAGRS